MKEYATPKAEKMEFNYAETVVASGTGCTYYVTKSDYNYLGCQEVEIKNWTGNQITG